MSMATEHSGGTGERYERRDADVRMLLKFAFWLFVILVAVLISMKWIFFYYSRVQPLGPPASPFEQARVLPPQPRLQVAPRTDLKKYCEAQQQELSNYGWLDAHNGVVRIPVDRAMDLVLERGLPARPAENSPAGAAPAAAGAATPGAPDVAGLQGPCGYVLEPAPRPAPAEKER